jgi:hypothetical protein
MDVETVEAQVDEVQEKRYDDVTPDIVSYMMMSQGLGSDSRDRKSTVNQRT